MAPKKLQQVSLFLKNKYFDLSKSNNITLNCSICLEDIDCKHCFSLLSCGHPFHFQCIAEQTVCPLCRA